MVCTGAMHGRFRLIVLRAVRVAEFVFQGDSRSASRSSTKLGEVGANSVGLGPHLAVLGLILVNVGRVRANLGQVRANCVELAEFARSKFGRIG